MSSGPASELAPDYDLPPGAGNTHYKVPSTIQFDKWFQEESQSAGAPLEPTPDYEASPDPSDSGAGSSPIGPRKLPNPVLSSAFHRQMQDELKWNSKNNISVLNKPELQREMARRRVAREKKDHEARQMEKRTSFELALESRRENLEKDGQLTSTKEEPESDFLRNFHKVKGQSAE